jgi:hypothetical protein
VGARCGLGVFSGNWEEPGSKTNEVLTLEEKLVSGPEGFGDEVQRQYEFKL